MFFEGAPRLIRAGVMIPLLQAGDPSRIVVEAYPSVLARQLIGRVGYKNDAPAKQTEKQHLARLTMLACILNGQIEAQYGLRVEGLKDLSKELADDPSGDQLDALLCAIQAAWAWTMREHDYGAPRGADALEGWIADPDTSELLGRKRPWPTMSSLPRSRIKASKPPKTHLSELKLSNKWLRPLE
jgi:hypothetical protein